MKNRKKDRYFFNPESLQFESVSQNIWPKVRRIASILATSFLFAAIYYAVFSLFFFTPMEQSKRHENELLKDELVKLNTRYNLLENVIGDLQRRDTLVYRAIFEANPLNLNELTSVGSAHQYEALDRASNIELIKGSADKLALVQQSARRENILIDSLKSLMEANKETLQFIPAILPIRGADISSAGASVGEKINPFYKSLSMHTGMDFTVPVGSEVVATADGTVKEVWYSLFGSGNRVVIDHGNDYETRYLYLDNEVKVRKGASVKRGQVIGLVGNLGMTVPHLHYEVRRGGKIADPLNYFFLELTPQQYEQIMLISLNNGQSLD